MFSKVVAAAVGALFATSAIAQVEIPVTGTVQSKCVVTTDTIGIYGNPAPETLSTAQVDGGVQPIVRFDVLQASYYKARVIHPNYFTESPDLTDAVTWTGSTTVAEVTDPLMADYDNDKIEYDNVTEVDLTVAGSTWFKVQSQASYSAGNKAFPAGTYRTVVGAECIAL